MVLCDVDSGGRWRRLHPKDVRPKAEDDGTKQRWFSSQILERSLEPDSSDEEPPPVYSPPSYDMHIYDRKYPEAPPTPPPR